MHGPKKRAGGVAATRGRADAVEGGAAGADQTDHHLLVGKGAQDFARHMGFTIEDDLNTEKSRNAWLEWKRRPIRCITCRRRSATRPITASAMQMIAEGSIDAEHYYGTINCDGINAKGEICGVTTTSGLSFKIPGRAGDSPILGAGCMSTARSARPDRRARRSQPVQPVLVS